MIISPETKFISRLQFDMHLCDGTFIRKCRICEKPSFSFPMQIVAEDNSTLCSQHSEAYAPELHYELKTYLDKYPHRLRKTQTDRGQTYTLVTGLNRKDDDGNIENYFVRLETYVSIISDAFNISSFYYLSSDPEKIISGIQYKTELNDNTKKTEFVRKKSLQFIDTEIINCLLLIDSEKLDFDSEHHYVIK